MGMKKSDRTRNNGELRDVFANRSSPYSGARLTIRVYGDIQSCTRCHGTGWYEDDKDRYGDSGFSKCKHCQGKGRYIKETQSIDMDHTLKTDTVATIPILTEDDERHRSYYASLDIRIMEDRRNSALEAKYPELAALTYDRYHEMLEKCMVIEALKKEHK